MSSFIMAGVGADDSNVSGDLRVGGNVFVSAGNVEALVIGNSATILKGNGALLTGVALAIPALSIDSVTANTVRVNGPTTAGIAFPLAVTSGSARSVSVNAQNSAGAYNPIMGTGDGSVTTFGASFGAGRAVLTTWSDARAGLAIGGDGVSELASNVKLTLNSANVAVTGNLTITGNATAPVWAVDGRVNTFFSANGVSVVASNPDSGQYGMVGWLGRTNAGNVGLTFSQAGVSAFGILHPTGGGLSFLDNRYPWNLGGSEGGGGGTERMRIDKQGNVGIANTNPIHNLAVNGTSYLNGAVTSTGAISTSGTLTVAGATAASTTQVLSITSGSKRLAVTANLSQGSYTAMAQAGDVALVSLTPTPDLTALLIAPYTSAGRVGLRLDSVTGQSELASYVKLTLTSANVAVAGNLFVTGNVSAANVTASSGAGKGFFGNGRSITNIDASNLDAGLLPNARLNAIIPVDLIGNAISASTLILGAGGSEKVRVDTNGNVGIGNSAAVHSLSVNGTGYVSGGLFAANVIGNALFLSTGNAQLGCVSVNSFNAMGLTVGTLDVQHFNGAFAGTGQWPVLSVSSYDRTKQITFHPNSNATGPGGGYPLIQGGDSRIMGTGPLVLMQAAAPGSVGIRIAAANATQQVGLIGNVGVSGNLFVVGNLIQTGDMRVSGNVIQTGDMSVSGNVTASKQIVATGNVISNSFLRGNGGAVLGVYDPYPVSGSWLGLNVGSLLLQGGKTVGQNPSIAFNSYWSGTQWIRSETGVTSSMGFGGSWQWFSDVSGLANTAFTPTVRMTLSTTGDLSLAGNVNAVQAAISGISYHGGIATFGSNVNASAAAISGLSYVGGIATFNSNVNASAASISGLSYLGGAVTLGGTLTAAAGNVNAAQLSISGLSYFGNDVTTPGKFVATGRNGTGAASGASIEGVAPSMRWVETDQGADGKEWNIQAISGNLRLAAINDANNGLSTALVVKRSGTSIVAMDFGDGTLNVPFGFLGSGIATFGGNVNAAQLSLSGNATFSGTRVFGDFDAASGLTTRTYISGVSGTFTSVGAIPPSGGNKCSFDAWSTADTVNGAFASFGIGTTAFVEVGQAGSATYLPLIYNIGGSERMRIDTNGNVGIGTAAAVHRLSVSGTSYLNGAVSVQGGSNTAPAGISFAGGDPGVMIEKRYAANDRYGIGQYELGTTRVYAASSYSQATVRLCFPTSETAFTDVLTATKFGNVGIATSAPASRLQIGTTVQTQTGTPERLSLGGTYSDAAGQNPKLLLFQGSTTYGLGVSADRLDYMVPTNASHVFYVNAAEKMRIHTNGNVGIGTTGVPAYQLQLSTDSAGKPTSSTWTIASDRRVKLDIEDANLDLCYSVVKNLPLRRYAYDPVTFTDEMIKDRNVVGWIAQEVQAVLPKAVSESAQHGYDDFLSLDVDQIYKTMYGALQKVMADKETLEDRVAALEARVTALEP